MRYGLVSRHSAITTREIKGYSLIPGYKCNEKNLQDIDAFCQKFNNEEELKTFLLDAGLINTNEWNEHIVIAKFDNRYAYPRGFMEPSFKYEIPFFKLDFLLNYYLNNILDLNFMAKFRRRFQSNKDIDHHFLRLYYELMTGGTLDDYSKETLKKVMKDFIKNFIYYFPTNTKERKINYLRLRILAKFASKDAREKGITKLEDNRQEGSFKTIISDDALRLELKHRYNELKDNPTDEEKEAIFSRINEIEGYFKASKNLNDSTLTRKKYIKKERPELYD